MNTTRRLYAIIADNLPRVLNFFLLPLLMAASLEAQTTGAEEAAIRDVVKHYVDARERRDPKAIEALFTGDADQLVSSGEWRKGRDNLVRGTLESSGRNSGTRTINLESVRLVSPDVAIADGRYEISGTGGAEARRMWTSFVLKKSPQGWRIAAIRNMLPAPSK